MRGYNIERTWITEAGLKAVCIMVEGSHRCGYVGVLYTHALYGKYYDDIHRILPELEVHGGLTHSSQEWPTSYPVEGGLHWFGFDCAHLGDAVGYRQYQRPGDVLRTQEFVEAECEKLAKQLAEVTYWTVFKHNCKVVWQTLVTKIKETEWTRLIIRKK